MGDWIKNDDNDSNYFGPIQSSGSPAYIDLQPIYLTGNYVATGLELRQKSNRVALVVTAVDTESKQVQTFLNDVMDPSGSAYTGSGTYADTTPITCPAGTSVISVKLQMMSNPGNRFGVAIRYADNGTHLNPSDWVSATPSATSYFQGQDGVEGLYVDTNTPTVAWGSYADGFALWQKMNRVAVMVRQNT